MRTRHAPHQPDGGDSTQLELYLFLILVSIILKNNVFNNMKKKEKLYLSVKSLHLKHIFIILFLPSNLFKLILFPLNTKTTVNTAHLVQATQGNASIVG